MSRVDRPSRRQVLAVAAATPVLASLACSVPRQAVQQTPAPTPPPRVPKHLIVLVSDDQSRFDVGCYGNRSVHTPHLDALAASGARFERGYVVVGVCKPSRSAMYTGLYPHRNGATGFKPIDAHVATWCELLPPERCATGMIGKLNVKPAEKFRFESWVRPKAIGDARESDPVANALRAMIKGFGERRMAIVVNLKDPHRPFREPLRDPSDPAAPIPHDPAALELPPSMYDTPETRAEFAQYYDVVWRLDKTVGALLAVLDECGIADDTLLVMTSDNGQSFPFAKTTLYEAGINVPFLVRWPGVVAPGTVSNALVSLVDLLPTALDTFGVARTGLDGHSLLPLLRGDVSSVRDEFVGEHTEHLVGKPTPARSIRDARWKYIKNFPTDGEFANNVLDHSTTWRSWVKASKNDAALRARMKQLVMRPPEELYDLAHDPFELTNLAGVEQHAAQLERMRSRLAEWMRSSADPLGAQ
ncbi:MAG: sulfatase [Planctomycetes bacterium]|nr:sulfatase [Planctomycetota bacterium]